MSKLIATGRRLEDRGVEDVGNRDEYKTARRILAAFQHPDCPVLVLDYEASKLARFVSIRLNRLKGTEDVSC